MSGKSIVKNSIFNVIYKGFTALFPLLTSSYIARVLLPEGVGRVSYGNAVVTAIVAFASLGIPNYGVKAIAAASDDLQKRSKCFAELLCINAISTAICCFVYYFAVNALGAFPEKTELMNVMGILLILNFLNIDWFYQGMEAYSYITTRSIIIKVLSFLTMLLVVKTPDDDIKYALILCAATAGNYLLNFFHAGKYLTRPAGKPELSVHIKQVMLLLITLLATEIYTVLDTVMLEYFHGDTPVGYYTNAVKIVRMVYTVAVAMVAPFYPRISKYYSEQKTDAMNDLLSVGTKIILLLCVPMTLGLFFTADLIVPVLFGEPFRNSIFVLKELSVLVTAFSVAYFLGHIVLMSTGNEKKILRATLVGAATNAVCNAVLIPIAAERGAAAASVIAELAVTAVLVINAANYFRLKIHKKYIISIAIASSVMVPVVYLLKTLPDCGVLQLFAIIIGAAAAYFGVLLLCGNEIIIQLINKLKQRGR